jgi:hypothetical protein
VKVAAPYLWFTAGPFGYCRLLAMTALIVGGFSARSFAQEPSPALLPLSASAAPASTVEIDVVVVNRSMSEGVFTLGEQFTATMNHRRPG